MKSNMKEPRLRIICKCPFCGKQQVVETNSRDYQSWRNGTVIQRAMPYLNPTEREALMTGICDDCFPG